MQRTVSSHSREALASARAHLASQPPQAGDERAAMPQHGAQADARTGTVPATVPAAGAEPAAGVSSPRPFIGQMLVPEHFPRHARVVPEVGFGPVPSTTAGHTTPLPEGLALPRLLRISLRASSSAPDTAASSSPAPALAVRPVAVAPAVAPAAAASTAQPAPLAPTASTAAATPVAPDRVEARHALFFGGATTETTETTEATEAGEAGEPASAGGAVRNEAQVVSLPDGFSITFVLVNADAEVDEEADEEAAGEATGDAPGDAATASGSTGVAWSAPPMPATWAPLLPTHAQRPPKRERPDEDAKASATSSSAAAAQRQSATESQPDVDAEDRPVRQRR